MKRIFFGFLLGAAVLAAVTWHFRGPAQTADLDHARDKIVAGATNAEHAALSTLESLGLTSENIQSELARTGKVIRSKSQALGHTLANETADARITADIKAKLLADPDLSALSISVNTTASCVTLAGTTKTAGDISRAMLLAYNTDGVTQVISTLQAH
jgi:hyperosmotically inducible periplasmic protein